MRTIKILNISTLVIFVALMISVINEGIVLELDSFISTHIPNFQTPLLTKVVIFVTDINSVIGTIIFSILLILFLLYKKYYLDLKFYIFSYLGGSILFSVIKLLVERARPMLKIIDEPGLSFPSGHSTMSMVIALSIYFIFVKRLKSSRSRILLLISCISWPIIIVSTRLYLNVHWFSDTMAGVSLGMFWVTTMVFFLYKKGEE
ncbi:Membrane-associated phospholipid phosphatase [hydrothermal vent metagenome]|uniref:Membrane-associated phospholipid phosphatase n=1 Tax=hydrothermal vent metagenome TaxID=652676 RepID=A0A1W1EF28_9ZZZZ